MNFKFIFLSLLGLLLLSSSGVIAKAKQFSLSNGMQVVVIENNRAPVIAQMIWYNLGLMLKKKVKVDLLILWNT